jgi:hypothetical protein
MECSLLLLLLRPLPLHISGVTFALRGCETRQDLSAAGHEFVFGVVICDKKKVLRKEDVNRNPSNRLSEEQKKTLKMNLKLFDNLSNPYRGVPINIEMMGHVEGLETLLSFLLLLSSSLVPFFFFFFFFFLLSLLFFFSFLIYSYSYSFFF